MTSPLVSPEVDLRDFAYMPVDIARLFNSEFHAQSCDAAWRAGVTLWLKSYHQVPAASVPDNDVALARLAELARDMKTWLKIKDEAMRGWIKCSDGRFYHPVVAEKALEGWLEKLGQRKSSAAGNAKRYGQEFDPTPFEAAISDSLERLAAINPSSRMLAKRLPRASRPPPDGSPDGTPERIPSGSQGKGREGKEKKESSLRSPKKPESDEIASELAPRPSPSHTPRAILLGCLPPDLADAVIEHRQKLRAPLTGLAAAQLVKGFLATGNPAAAATMMVARGWRGFKPEWYENDKSNGNEKSIHAAAKRLHERIVEDDILDFGKPPPPLMLTENRG